MIKKGLSKFNLVILIIIAFLWISVFWIHGIVGTISWILLKLFIPIIGFVMLIIFISSAVLSISKHNNVYNKIISIILSLILIFPILITMSIVPLAYPIDKGKTVPSLTIPSPFAEDSIIAWGGDNLQDNEPHAMWSSERWAYDIVMTPFSMEKSTTLSDYGIWNKNVFSPVEGTVVATYSQDKDIPPNATEFLSLEGNYVYIKVKDTGTYLMMNHLKKGSIVVKIGQELKVGEIIGKIGNSGTTSEPHLHIHHQRQNPTTTLHPLIAEGLPLYFKVTGQSKMLIKNNKLKGFNTK